MHQLTLPQSPHQNIELCYELFHQPYSPESTTCNFLLFPNMKTLKSLYKYNQELKILTFYNYDLIKTTFEMFISVLCLTYVYVCHSLYTRLETWNQISQHGEQTRYY